MSISAWIILGVANIPLFVAIGWVFFKDAQSFVDAIRFWLTPDLISAFRGELWEDTWAQFMLLVWGAACAGCVYTEGFYLSKWLG